MFSKIKLQRLKHTRYKLSDWSSNIYSNALNMMNASSWTRLEGVQCPRSRVVFLNTFTVVISFLKTPFERKNVKMTSSYHVASQRIRELLGAFFKYENAVFNGEQEKESISL